MSKSKAKGTAAETAVVDYLAQNGFPHAERRVTKGAGDTGDVAAIPGVVIEIKNCARLELAQWLDEAVKEQRNAHASIGVVWHKRRNKGNPGQWFVTMSGEQFVALLRDDGPYTGYAPEPTEEQWAEAQFFAGTQVKPTPYREFPYHSIKPGKEPDAESEEAG